MNTPQPPAAPNPYQTAQQQQGINTQTAIANSELNNVNQITPYGSIRYWQNGTVGGIPQFTATTTLSPELQALSNTDIANSQIAANTEGELAQNIQSTLAKPLDLSPNATSAYLDKLATAELDPQLAQQQTQLNQMLADQGLTPGSEGWKYQQGQFGLNSAQQLNDLYLQGQNTAISALEAQYNEPINALSALQSQSQVSQPGIGTLAPTTQSPIAPANLSSDVYNTAADNLAVYQGQLSQNNALTGGLFGLGGNLLGGGLKLFSDREDKTDIQKLGKDPESGLDMFAYRYKNDEKNTPKVVGPFAQDVEKKYPGSTEKIGGHMVISPLASRKFGLGLAT